MEVIVEPRGASDFGFTTNELTIRYYVDEGVLASGNRSYQKHTAPLKLDNGTVKLRLLIDRSSLEVFGNDWDTKDGSGIRDYIHVSDLADIHLKSLNYIHSKPSLLLNCGYGKGFSVLDVINTANKISGDKIDYKFSNRRAGDVEQLIADTSKILKHIDWRPKYNDLSEIINSSIRWEEKINESNT